LLAELGSTPDVLLVGNTLEAEGAVQMQPSARALVEIAATRETVAASEIAPLYLRKSDAELNADRG